MADAVRCSGAADDRAPRLAVKLVDHFVPSASLAGVDLAGLVAPGAEGHGGEPTSAAQPVDGFRRDLVAGGQGAEAIRHFAAAAAAVLHDRRLLVPAAIAVDAVQGLMRRRWAEARAEIADDRAGAAVGRLLGCYLQGDLEREEVVRCLRQLLCT